MVVEKENVLIKVEVDVIKLKKQDKVVRNKMVQGKPLTQSQKIRKHNAKIKKEKKKLEKKINLLDRQLK